MSIINEAAVLRYYLDTQEYSDRLTAIEAQAASSLATHKTEVATAIAQVNLTQSQTITALTLEVNNLRTELTNSITATQTDLINRADQLAQDVTDITVQLTQDKATFTQEIQDALDSLQDEASLASALRTPRKIQGVAFDGTQDISLPTFTTETDGLVPKREGVTTTKYLREDGTWVVPTDTTYALLTKVSAEDGTATTANTISAQVLKEAIQYHAPTVTNITGNAGTATKLQTPRTINGVLFDGTQNISLPEAVAYSLPTASDSVLGGIRVGSGLAISNSVLSVGTLNQSTTGNAATATKLQTPRTISLTGNITGSVNFDGSANASITTAITGLGVANGIATLDSNGQVPSTQLPSYVDDVLEYGNVAAFPATGETGKIYVETAGNITYRWSGTAYVKITSGEVASVAGKSGVVTLTKTDVGLPNVDDTSDSSKNVASATKLTTARTIGGVAFDGTTNISLPGVNTAGNQNTSGNAATAAKFQTARTIAISGAVTGTSTSFDGSSDIAIATTAIDGSKISTGTIPAARIPTLNQNTTGNAATASKLATAVNINGVPFDGSQDINIDVGNGEGGSGVVYSAMTNTEAQQGTSTSEKVITPAVLKSAIQYHAPEQTDITGNAATATKLETPRTINGVSFDGTADVSTTTWGTARTLTIGRTEKSVNGSANVAWTSNEILPTGTIGQVLKHDGTSWVAGVDSNTLYSAMLATEANTGTATSVRVITAAVLKGAIQAHTPVQTSVTGNAGSATKLQTARLINGIAFDGTGDINLDVYSKSGVDTAIANATPTIPNATEATAGKAKIATTAIAQVGVNDTDIMTPKKVKDQVSMGGRIHANAYISTVGGVNTILASKNILSVVRTSNGVQKVTTATNMDNINFTVQATGAAQPGVSPTQGYLIAERLNVSNLPIRTLSSFELVMSNGADLADSFRWGVTVIC